MSNYNDDNVAVTFVNNYNSFRNIPFSPSN